MLNGQYKLLLAIANCKNNVEAYAYYFMSDLYTIAEFRKCSFNTSDKSLYNIRSTN